MLTTLWHGHLQSSQIHKDNIMFCQKLSDVSSDESLQFSTFQKLVFRVEILSIVSPNLTHQTYQNYIVFKY